MAASNEFLPYPEPGSGPDELATYNWEMSVWNEFRLQFRTAQPANNHLLQAMQPQIAFLMNNITTIESNQQSQLAVSPRQDSGTTKHKANNDLPKWVAPFEDCDNIGWLQYVKLSAKNAELDEKQSIRFFRLACMTDMTRSAWLTGYELRNPDASWKDIQKEYLHQFLSVEDRDPEWF